MKDSKNFVWRILYASHAKHYRERLTGEYGDLLAKCEQDELDLQLIAVQS